MSEVPFKLTELIGQTIIINPQSLLNKKRLYTVQSWIDTEKMINALKGRPTLDDEPPRGWISWEKNNLVYTLSDGNHRTALGCIEGIITPFLIDGIWSGNKNRYGFNIIIQKVRHDLKQLNGGD